PVTVPQPYRELWCRRTCRQLVAGLSLVVNTGGWGTRGQKRVGRRKQCARRTWIGTALRAVARVGARSSSHGRTSGTSARSISSVRRAVRVSGTATGASPRRTLTKEAPMSGRVVPFEIPYDDGDRARSFYERAFGWQLMVIPDMGYTLVMSGPSGDQGPTEPG